MKKTLFSVLFFITCFVFASEPYREVLNLDPSGYTIELDDGSIWRVCSGSTNKVRKFFEHNDQIIIYPVIFPALSGSEIYFYNKTKNISANVELSLGPVPSRTTHVVIDGIDFRRGLVSIVDNLGISAIWKIPSCDLPIFREWEVGDSVMLGSNLNYARWFGSTEEYILINASKRDFVQARNY